VMHLFNNVIIVPTHRCDVPDAGVYEGASEPLILDDSCPSPGLVVVHPLDDAVSVGRPGPCNLRDWIKNQACMNEYTRVDVALF
jgi:hypothetical protein